MPACDLDDIGANVSVVFMTKCHFSFLPLRNQTTKKYSRLRHQNVKVKLLFPAKLVELEQNGDTLFLISAVQFAD